MRCPKCHYLSFEPEPRCKNCGYDLSFEPGELVFSSPESPSDPLADFDLQLGEAVTQPPRRTTDAIDLGTIPAAEASIDPHIEIDVFAPSAERMAFSVPEAAEPVEPARPVRVEFNRPPRVDSLRRAVPTSPSPALTAELPLFVQGLSEPESQPEHDAPLVKLPRAPRLPLSVRRPTPAPGRVREKYQREATALRQVGLLGRDLLEPRPRDDQVSPPPATPNAPLDAEAAGDRRERVGALRRLEAAALDLVLIGAINVTVVWLTLQRLDLSVNQAALVPVLPVAAFLFLIDGGYLLMFTATQGQTIGKMAAGIRVIGTSADAIINDRVTLKQAALRAILTFPSVLAFGLGFIPALVGHGLAWHDRFAHTRVVRA